MYSRCRWILIVLLALAASLITLADRPQNTQRSPEEIAKLALEALSEDRVPDFAALMHPEALKQLKATLLSVVEAAEQTGVADMMLGLFNDVDTVDQLRALDDAAFFTAFLEGMMLIQPAMRDALHGMKIEVIGHVAEGKDVVHVVYRGTVSQGKSTLLSKMAVMSLKSHQSGWRMLLLGDMEALAAALKQQFAGTQ